MRNIESNIQRQCVAWYRLMYRNYANLLFAVPNGGARNRITASIMKGEGVTSGVADLILMRPNSTHHGLCIEMKRDGDKLLGTTRGRQSESQREWQRAVEGEGYRYEVCHSLDEFRKVVTDYLGN